MKRVLITGAAGFIGSALVPELEKNGYVTYVLDNLSFGKRDLLDIPDDRFVLGDITDRTLVQKEIARISPHWIIHLAAIHFIPYCNQNPYESANINIQGTINVLDAAKKLDCLERVLFASTAAVYPIVDTPIPETFVTNPLDIYGLSKLAGERLMNEFYLETQIPSIICRFFNAFGPRETNAHLIPEIHRQIVEGKRKIQLGNLDPQRDFIHTSDMSLALRLLLEKFETGIDTFNIGSGKEYSVRAVVQAFERAIGESIEIQVDPARVRKVERHHLCADIQKLTEFLDWEPAVSLDRGIQKLIDDPHTAFA
ncbi:GDP-mannose 4,6-dehydratase [Chamaesiphon sp. VAR_48_metabat_135_sub]|uniref:NAD-dependent epimerase/dehydratase family protein n=1 Tax=Chamaesiphon sp. VAR_48_metabat_135_sub TaxID=2964699 RepID=UPI00286C6A29|nr:GDP-mannose 4,6-dehydratase [Chamaesiphon sp. VAR_48_metabat_135_sub]